METYVFAVVPYFPGMLITICLPTNMVVGKQISMPRAFQVPKVAKMASLPKTARGAKGAQAPKNPMAPTTTNVPKALGVWIAVQKTIFFVSNVPAVAISANSITKP